MELELGFVQGLNCMFLILQLSAVDGQDDLARVNSVNPGASLRHLHTLHAYPLRSETSLSTRKMSSRPLRAIHEGKRLCTFPRRLLLVSTAPQTLVTKELDWLNRLQYSF